MQSIIYSYLLADKILFSGSLQTRKMDNRKNNHHVLLITFHAQGHINPVLQFAKTLTRIGTRVTFSTTVSALNRMTTTTTLKGLNLAPFSDGYDDQIHRGRNKDPKEYWSGFIREASSALRNVIHSSSGKGCPVTCLVYSPWFPWAATVVREYGIPSATLWIQPAMVMDIYYHYFHGYEDEVKNVDMNDPTWSVQFPGLPLLKSRDLPSFMLPLSDPMSSSVLTTFRTLMEGLDNEDKPNVLVNTFHALEHDALRAIGNYNMIPIGPLIPNDNSHGIDLFLKSKDCKQWLDSKDFGSVIYVSFGSIVTLPKKQMEEIASGLLKTGRPFLWVIRAKEDGKEETEEEKLSCMEELEQKGMIVPWCSQLEVLTHPSVGCFVTHCGWNSTLESIVCGVPVIAFPNWSDQGTNAKLVEDVWRTGVRVVPSEEGTVERDEIARCIDMVMDGGEKASELRNNVKKWKELGGEAMKEGGSSDKNLNSFLEGLV